MTDNWLDKSKKKIIKEFFEKKDKKKFKWFQIQAWPWTWKTYLLSKIISKYIEEWSNESFYVLSHSNSSIDSISNKIWSKNSIKIKTIASFYIENFIIPFSYNILKNEKFDHLTISWKNYWKIEFVDTNNIKLFLKNITNNFSENSIEPNSPWWDILDKIIETFLIEDKYFELFHSFLIQKKIKYFFIDEYQDTKECYLNIFNKIIKKWKIKFICVWDKNQQINYENLKDEYFYWLEGKVLKTTYRFWKNILNKTNNIIESWIEKSINLINDWNIEDKLWYIPNSWTENERLINLSNFIIKYIENNSWKFIWKNNIILFQPTTDYGFWEKFNNKLKELLKSNSNIIFSYTEKPIYNIHLKLFFEKLILFLNWNFNYKEVEKQLSFFYMKWENNYKDIFFNILKLKKSDNISVIWGILQNHWFKEWWNYKTYFKEIIENFEKNKINFNDANWKTLIELLNKKEDDKIYISTSTITSSKWKEYDNIFIINIYNKKSFSKELNNNNEEAKRHYYVAVSRAKENVFTFVDY